MFPLEVAMDELAEALGMDAVELRRVNEPERDPVPVREALRIVTGEGS